MPRFLPSVLDAIERWPRVEGATYHYVDGDGLALYPEGGSPLARYLRSISVWQGFGFVIDDAARGRIRKLWKHRPDLREVLGEAIGGYVCPEFKRPFLREIMSGGSGDVAAWVAAYPDLRAPLLEHLHAETRRFNHPFAVVRACSILTRALGEPTELWRAAALAIHRDDRRQARRPPARRDEYLRHDLETHETLYRGEAAEINRHLAALGGERLDLMEYGYWWHQPPRPCGLHLSIAAAASHAVAGDRWGEDDVRFYARALAALPAENAGGFADEEPALVKIKATARALAG